MFLIGHLLQEGRPVCLLLGHLHTYCQTDMAHSGTPQKHPEGSGRKHRCIHIHTKQYIYFPYIKRRKHLFQVKYTQEWDTDTVLAMEYGGYPV